MWDLLIKGGRLLDPGQDIDATQDVAISGERIAAIGTDLDRARASKVLDASGKLVTPGLIDIHTHVFRSSGVSSSLDPDPTSLAYGVTTVLDAGSATPLEYPKLRQQLAGFRTRVFSLLRMPAPHGPEGREGVTAMRPAVREWAGEVIGIKFHHSQGYQSLLDAREASDFLGCLFMAEPYGPAMSHLLEYLKPYDILTHAFHTWFRSSLFGYDGELLPAVRAAMEREVRFDVGHGDAGFSFRTMERCMEKGLQPFTLSTDLHANCVDGPAFDMPYVIGKFMAIGMSLEDAILRSTYNPALAIGQEHWLGTLRPGHAADISIWHIEEGEFTFWDVIREERKGNRRLDMDQVMIGGETYTGPQREHLPPTHQAVHPPGFKEQDYLQHMKERSLSYYSHRSSD
jgi:dihydroorotase